MVEDEASTSSLPLQPQTAEDALRRSRHSASEWSDGQTWGGNKRTLPTRRSLTCFRLKQLVDIIN